ncbi:uncharacterized protein [Eurosta solidaginis]|uniref:uncharacterized protein n=1 Tax=Eurosta solidaginis TaxID=178769 RepID=UPI0035316B70
MASDYDTKLVDLVRANPLLYEKEVRNSPYDLMKKKTELWRSIASSLGAEGKFCVSRWKNLRDRYRRELQKAQEMQRKAGGARNIKGSNWHLWDKMKFLEGHIRLHSSHSTKSVAENTKSSWSEMEAEQFVEHSASEDDPLQEAMEEQSISMDTKKPDIELYHTTATASSSSYIKRIETLLDGMDTSNRTKAEKRIVAYLCKCQLKALNNEAIDDIAI